MNMANADAAVGVAVIGFGEKLTEPAPPSRSDVLGAASAEPVDPKVVVPVAVAVWLLPDESTGDVVLTASANFHHATGERDATSVSKALAISR